MGGSLVATTKASLSISTAYFRDRVLRWGLHFRKPLPQLQLLRRPQRSLAEFQRPSRSQANQDLFTTHLILILGYFSMLEARLQARKSKILSLANCLLFLEMMRALKRTLFPLLTIVLLLITGHRLPAPIQ